MSIKIYTYSDPYKINEEPFWNEIKNSAQFCVSQTMVNGMNLRYRFEKCQLTTIVKLIDALYFDWESLNTRVKQIMEVDWVINSMIIEDELSVNIKKSLSYNLKNIVSCIRLFKELGLSSSHINSDLITFDQKYLIEIYKIIEDKKNSVFNFSHVLNEEKVNEAIDRALRGKKEDNFIDTIDRDTVVIHGIHQFSASMLCAISDISKYKNVILLFNYQEQYKNIYQTWINIYSMFDIKISTLANNQFRPFSLMINSYASNVLADSIGEIFQGEFIKRNSALDDLEVIEFENITEFAGYVAERFKYAEDERLKSNENKSAIYFMSEQMYSASSKVNDILRAYFPEQFGERHFLDYPIGHFFVSTVNMWDNENKKVAIRDFSDIRECLTAGIISEKSYGQNINTFNQVAAFVEKENTLEGVILKLRELKKIAGKSDSERSRIEYFQVNKQDLIDLINSLEELNRIINEFFSDFDKGGDNFRRFYSKIHNFIVKKSEEKEKFDDEINNVLKKLVDKLSTSDLPNTGTFICLKETLNFYLSQDEKALTGANWIVRGFEQIDGDIIRSEYQDAEKTTYHFCCLSDKDICSVKDEKLPWPLDLNFFEYACQPLDWKYRIFLKSKMEYKNFKRYALLYGLEFNRVGCKLSYVKNENDKENDLYYALKLLNIKVTKYKGNVNTYVTPRLQFKSDGKSLSEFETNDIIKWEICKYRFALESIIQNKTVYRNRFLIQQYVRILLENYILKEKQNKRFNEQELKQALLDQYDVINTKFKISNDYEKNQLISAALKNIKKRVSRSNIYPIISSKEDIMLSLKEDFIDIEKIKDISDDLSRIVHYVNDVNKYEYELGTHCKYCSCRDICLQYSFDS